MIAVHLGFKAFDIHELACHFVAQHAGLYAARGFEVHLLDTTFLADEQLPPRTFHAACTAALIAGLRGAPLRIVFVACERPMFWLVGRSGSSEPQELAGGRIAGYPPGTPPAELLRLLLHSFGLARGEEPAVLAARDDHARLGLLRAGEVQAAVISSAMLPASHRRGLAPICFFGDALRVPTTGLAVHREFQAREPELVRAMCACYRESLRRLREDDRTAREAMAAWLDFAGADADEAVAAIRRCYTAGGRCATDVLDAAIESMRWALGEARPRRAAELYDFSALEGAP